MSADNYDLTPVDGGNLTPLSPSVPTLQPTDNWVVPQPDFITEHQSYSGSTPQFFGQSLPPGANPEIISRALNEISTIYLNDARKLGISQSFASQAATWFKSNALLPMAREWPNHGYDLRGWTFPPADENAVTAFLNWAHSVGGSQKEIEASLYWLNELGKYANAPAQPQTREYTDAEWAALERRYADDAQKAEAVLRREWGFQYESNLAIAQRALNNLPKNQREHIANDALNDGTSALNSPDVVMFLFQQAVGVSENMSGGNLAKRIAEIEHMIKVDRKAYNDSPEIQAELRHLYAMRG